MPFYDRTCTACDWRATDVLEPVHLAAPACLVCGAPTVRAWFSTPAAVIGDEMDHLQVNGTKDPIRFRSKAARRRWMAAEGFRDGTRHVGTAGSDRSAHTTNWATTYDPYTAANVKILIERAFHAGTTHEAEAPLLPNARFVARDATPEEIVKYAQR